MAMEEKHTPIWEEIDRAESYLVCCLFDEAASLASSILRRLLEKYNRSNTDCEIAEAYENEWDDMLESAGMVLVQSLKQLLRTSEILKQLKLLFGSLTVIPVQVFLTGVCFQMSESPLKTVQGSLEEFLNNWRYVDGRYYPLLGAEANVSDTEGSCFRFSIGVDEYLEVVDFYVIKLLAMTIKDTDLAISWVEKAMLPVEKQQDLLRQLQSINSSNATTSQTSVSPQLPNEYKTDLFQDQKLYNGQCKDIESKYFSHGQITAKEEILKLSRQRVPYLRWFPIISLRLGNIRIVVPNGKMLLVSVLLLLYYITRKKQAVLKRFLAEKVLSAKKALLDLWQLVFSYQVNPLAAVQTLPAATRGNH